MKYFLVYLLVCSCNKEPVCYIIRTILNACYTSVCYLLSSGSFFVATLSQSFGEIGWVSIFLDSLSKTLPHFAPGDVFSLFLLLLFWFPGLRVSSESG